MSGSDGQVVNFLFSASPGLVVLFGVYALYRSYRLITAPWLRRIGVVIDERSKVVSQSDRVNTVYFCPLQWEAGDRTEMKINAKLAGTVTRGDIGIVYTKLDQLISFRRVEVQ